jgi:hypothetical protein
MERRDRVPGGLLELRDQLLVGLFGGLDGDDFDFGGVGDA